MIGQSLGAGAGQRACGLQEGRGVRQVWEDLYLAANRMFFLSQRAGLGWVAVLSVLVVGVQEWTPRVSH